MEKAGTGSKLLISGNGSGHGTVIMYSVLTLIVGVVGLGVAFWLANEVGYTRGIWGGTQRNELWTWFRVGGVIILIVAALEALFMYIRCSGTEVSVYENEVRGKGVGIKISIFSER